jgi:tetratricopeptide (TPR) repeat protein
MSKKHKLLHLATLHVAGPFVGMALALAGVVLAAPEAGAQECISKEAKDNLSHCPGGKFKANVDKKPTVSFQTAPEGFKKKDRIEDIKPVNPTDITKSAQRDERAGRLQPKVRKLLLTEISNVEKLYKSTPKNDKDRPKLMRRLAENYVELESSAFRDKVEAEVKAQQLRKKNPKKAAQYKKEAGVSTKIIKTARDSAIKYYKKLKKDYPQWCQFPNSPPAERGCADEVLYYLAYEYEQAGDFDRARKAYLELTEKFKKSRFVPNAYLAFGELYFNEAQGDPTKWPVAANFYTEVLKYPAPENKLWGYAAYKLGYVHWNMGEYAKAIDKFKEVIDFGQNNPQLPNAPGLAKSARRDIVPVYALAGKPDQAYGFFKPISGDSGASSAKTYGMMEDLGQNLLDTGHYPEAIVLYKDLIKRQPRSENSCFYQAQIAQAVMASQSSNKKGIVAELKSQLEVHDDFIKGQHGKEAKGKCSNTTAALLTETAMAWHLEAVGSGGVRGTDNAETKGFAADLYDLVVKSFTADQFRGFKFPRIVKEDWPTISKVKYAMADLLYHDKKWEKCGPAFDSVVAEDPNGPNAAEAAFASVLCYQNIWAQKHADGSHQKGIGQAPGGREKPGDKKDDAEKFKPKPFSDEQKGMITAFNRYACYIKPPQNDAEALEQYVDVLYARARTYFEAQHWEEAALAFREVAITYPKQDAAIYAAQLYLESLNVMGSRLTPKKAKCFDMMGQDVPTFITSFCEGAKKEENEEQCSTLFRVQRDILRLKAQGLVKQADDGDPNRIKLYEEAAELYLDMWKKYGKEACEKKLPACEGSEEVLYNSAMAFQAARLIAKAISVRKVLLDPKYGLEKTDPAKKAIYQIGANYQAIAVYDLAADWYEKFATEKFEFDNGKGQKFSGADALSDAVVLRLGLGQHEKAIQDAKDFNDQYGRKEPGKAARIAFAIGSHYAGKEDWANAEKALGGNQMALIDKSGSLDVKIEAHALLGRVYFKQGKTANAEKEYGRVRDSWKNPGQMQKDLDGLGGTQYVKDRRLGKVVTAVGESLYFFADKKRQVAESIAFPKYEGTGEAADVDKFIKSKVKDWVDKKRPAVNEFRNAPYPKDWDREGFVPGIDPPLLWAELKSTYQSELDVASEPQRKRAKEAFLTCLDYSVKYQYFDEDSRSCEEWLGKEYPAEFHPIDEFKGGPTRVNSGLDERPQALNIDGTPVLVDTRAAEEDAESKDNKKKKDSD